MFGCSYGPFLGWHGWWGVFAVMAVIAVAAYCIVRHGGAKRRTADCTDSLNILKRRLAEGEITVEEFTTLKQYL